MLEYLRKMVKDYKEKVNYLNEKLRLLEEEHSKLRSLLRKKLVKDEFNEKTQLEKEIGYILSKKDTYKIVLKDLEEAISL